MTKDEELILESVRRMPRAMREMVLLRSLAEIAPLLWFMKALYRLGDDLGAPVVAELCELADRFITTGIAFADGKKPPREVSADDAMDAIRKAGG